MAGVTIGGGGGGGGGAGAAVAGDTGDAAAVNGREWLLLILLLFNILVAGYEGERNERNVTIDKLPNQKRKEGRIETLRARSWSSLL